MCSNNEHGGLVHRDYHNQIVSDLQVELAALENKLAELKKENAGIRGDFDLLFQHNLWTEDELSELAALKKDARHLANWARHRSVSDSLRDAINRILESTEEGN